MTEFVPTLTHATERDVDLVLVEELRCCRDFVEWFVEHLGITASCAEPVRVLHSKRRIFNRREIDIHVEVAQQRGKPIVLLVENKLDADEQTGQGVSYQDEKVALVREGRAAAAYVALVCPRAYAADAPAFAARFDAVISYEDVQEFLQRRAKVLGGELGSRMEHRAELISQAITKSRRGYEPVRVGVIAGFNQHYLELLTRLAPAVMPGPGLLRNEGKPSDSVSMIFDCKRSFPVLPAGLRPTRFAHELGRGSASRASYVNVQFRRWNRGFEKLPATDLQKLSSAGIEPGTWVDSRTGSGGIRFTIRTPTVDNQQPFGDVEALVAEGIGSAARLQAWLLANSDLLGRLRDLST